MKSDHRLSTYFSHSWNPSHLPLNLALWEQLAQKCDLLIDRPVRELGDAAPPWYISRIESLIRRSDAFVGCIPARERAADESLAGDWRLRCSPYILFETRLAERMDLPRFVLYDRDSRFQPREIAAPHARYLACRLSEVVARVSGGSHDQTISDAFAEWLDWLSRNVPPGRESESFQWACLVPQSAGGAKFREFIGQTVQAAGFDRPIDLSTAWTNDAELSQVIRSLSLLVVDLSDPETLPLYQLAHSQLVPSIRLHQQGGGASDAHLPKILRGHPAGYQLDTLPLTVSDENRNEVLLRARALASNATPIVTLADGRYELQQRGYKRHLVFVSHDSKSDRRQLVTEICNACREHGIDFWEYEERNRSGEHWKNNLDQALEVMTLFIPLLSSTYEQSPMCVKELDRANSRPAGEVTILPFLLGDRQRPSVQLRDRGAAHHQRLFESETPQRNALAVVENILKHIRK
jgi:hypothetical protein